VSLSGHLPHLIARHARTIDPVRVARHFSSDGRSKRWLEGTHPPRGVQGRDYQSSNRRESEKHDEDVEHANKGRQKADTQGVQRGTQVAMEYEAIAEKFSQRGERQRSEDQYDPP